MKNEIFLIRHGQASFGSENYDQLSETGKIQCKSLKTVSEIQILEQLICGTLKRHQQTAEIVLPHLPFEKLQEWNEMNYLDILSVYDPSFSNFEDIKSRLQQEKDPVAFFNKIYMQALDQWIRDDNADTYKQNYHSFHLKTKSALDHALSLPHNKHVIITSAGPIAEAVKIAMGISKDKFINIFKVIRNASVTKLTYSGGDFQLDYFNYYQYLNTSLQTLR